MKSIPAPDPDNGAPEPSPFAQYVSEKLAAPKPPPRELQLADQFRAMAAAVSFLQSDTPLLARLLKESGVDPVTINRRHFAALAGLIVKGASMEEADEKFCWVQSAEFTDSYPYNTDGMNVHTMTEVAAEKVEWVWPNRVPLGKLTLISGDPDLGKTWIVLDIIARVSRGIAFPDCPEYRHEPAETLWVSAEDSDADTIKPRLVALGGDPARVYSLRSVGYRPQQRYRNGKPQPAEPLKLGSLDLSRDIGALDKWLADHPLVRVIALDPLSAFLGGTDSHRNADVRSLLTPLTKLAERRRVAVIAINHLNKLSGGTAVQRMTGSVAFVAASRSSWLVIPSSKDRTRRMFLKVKGNLSKDDVGGLSYTLSPVAGRLVWDPQPVTQTADEVLRGCQQSSQAQQKSSTAAPARSDAKDWLLETLKDGPVPAQEIHGKAEADGLCINTLKAAKKELGVRSSHPGGPGTPWVWQLPQHD